jgi:hypothetical protein
VLVQFQHAGPTPSAEDVRQMFNLDDDEMDSQFGVIATDPKEGIYAVRVADQASKRVESVLATRPRNAAEGIFSDPKIEPFGPPEK